MQRLKCYKLTLLTPEEGIVLKDQSVVFSGEPPYTITWKKRSYKIVTVSDSESSDKLPRLVCAEVSTRELTDIAIFLQGL